MASNTMKPGIKKVGEEFDPSCRRFGDNNSYRHIVLENGLECLLISSEIKPVRTTTRSTHSNDSDSSVSISGTESPSGSQEFVEDGDERADGGIPKPMPLSSTKNPKSFHRAASSCSTNNIISALDGAPQRSPIPTEFIESDLLDPNQDFTRGDPLISILERPGGPQSQKKQQLSPGKRTSESHSRTTSHGSLNHKGKIPSALSRLSSRLSMRSNNNDSAKRDDDLVAEEDNGISDDMASSEGHILRAARTGSFVEKVHMTVTGHEESETKPMEDEDTVDDSSRGTRTKDVVAASMTVGAGYFDDPLEYQGLAHFLEHMIFMGSKNYENSNEFREFISEVGGSTNAVTMAEKTEFRFSCPSEYLRGAIERFSDCFGSPLLTEASARKEIESIESEFAIAKSREQVQINLVRSATARPGTPFRKFNYGNKRSLLGAADPVKANRRFPILMSQMRRFHDEHYIAPKMRFCVQGLESLDELEELVVSCFGSIRANPTRNPKPAVSRKSGKSSKKSKEATRPDLSKVKWPSKSRFNNKRFPFSYLPELPPQPRSFSNSISQSLDPPKIAAKIGIKLWNKKLKKKAVTNPEVTQREDEIAENAKAEARQSVLDEDMEDGNTDEFSPSKRANQQNMMWFRRQVRRGRTLGTVFFVESDTPGFHVIHLSWQLPSQLPHYRRNPTNYIAHLVGHEASGSISAKLKAQGLGTYLMAGVTPVNSFSSNAVCSLFTISAVLTEEGISKWNEIIGMVFGYLVMLRQVGPQEQVFREIVQSQELVHKYEDGIVASKFVTTMSCRMQPKSGVKYQDYLKGPRESEWDPAMIDKILAHLVARNCRIEVVSSIFRRGNLRIGQHVLPRVKSSIISLRHNVLQTGDSLINRRSGRLWMTATEPHTRVRFWVTPLYDEQMQAWRNQAENMVSNVFSLPPQNPYMPSNVKLHDVETVVRCKPFLSTLGKLKLVDWVENQNENVVVLGYLMQANVDEMRQSGVMHSGKVYVFQRILASGEMSPLNLARSRTPLSDRFSPDNEFQVLGQPREHFEDNVQSHQNNPPPSPDLSNWRNGARDSDGDTPAQAKARELLDNLEPDFEHQTRRSKNPAVLFYPDSERLMQFYFLQDSHFSTPRVYLRLSIYSPWIKSSALHAATMDVYTRHIEEAITSAVYAALLASMTIKLSVEGANLIISCSGFADSVPRFLEEVLTKMLACNVAGISALGAGPFTADQLRLHKSVLANDYNVKNSRAMKPDILLASSWSNESKKNVMGKVSVKMVQDCARVVFKECFIRLLMFGNCTSQFAFRLADAARELIMKTQPRSCHVPQEEVFQLKGKPMDRAAIIRLRDTWYGGELSAHVQIPASWRIRGIMNVYSRSYESTSVIIYFQLGKETPELRIWMKLTDLLMKEMLFFEMRTKAQIGYVVTCHASSVFQNGSFTIVVQSHKVDAVTICYLVDSFLQNVYRKAVMALSSKTFRKQLAAAAHLLMEANSTANSQMDRYWESVLRSHERSPPHWNQEEADGRLARLSSEMQGELSKEWYLEMFDRLLSPYAPGRRQLTHFIVGVRSTQAVNEKLNKFQGAITADPEEMEKNHYARVIKKQKIRRAAQRLIPDKSRQSGLRGDRSQNFSGSEGTSCIVM